MSDQPLANFVVLQRNLGSRCPEKGPLQNLFLSKPFSYCRIPMVRHLGFLFKIKRIEKSQFDSVTLPIV